MTVLELTDALTVRLHTDTLPLLARACRNMGAGENEAENAAYDALASAFTAAACSCIAYSYTKPEDKARMDEALAGIFAATDKE